MLLLDEPLAALDLKLRQRMLIELDLIHDEVGITFLYVTHDQGEAMSLSDRIAVMNDGRIEQLGTAGRDLRGAAHQLRRRVHRRHQLLRGRGGRGRGRRVLPARASTASPTCVCFNDKQMRPGDRVYLSVRPGEDPHLARAAASRTPATTSCPAAVEDVIYLGTHTKYWVRAQEYRLAVEQQHNRFVLDEQPIRWKRRGLDLRGTSTTASCSSATASATRR